MTSPFFVPISGGDDAPAINDALFQYKSVVLGPGNYQIDSMLTVTPNGWLQGQGRSTVIVKNFNGDAIDLRYGAQISNFYLDGASKTGRGVVIRAGQHYQRIYNCSITAENYCIDCDGWDAGGHLTIEDCFITRTPNLQAFSIKLPDQDGVSGGNRTLRAIRSSGGYGVNIAGANNTMIERCNMAQIFMTSLCRTLLAQNNRFGGPVIWRGHGHWIAFNNIANGIIIAGDCTQSLFINGHNSNPINRQDPASCNNIVW